MDGTRVEVVCLKDSHACGDDVSWKVSDEHHVTIHEAVVGDE
jgi:hypothetical protein